MGRKKDNDNEGKDKKEYEACTAKEKKLDDDKEESSIKAFNNGINGEEDYDFEEETSLNISSENITFDLNDEVQEVKKEMKINDIITQRSINLSVAKREFVSIIGEVGSSKSSLISSFLETSYTSVMKLLKHLVIKKLVTNL